MSLDGKVAIVTGVTKPKTAGRAIALDLAAEGASVTVTDRAQIAHAVAWLAGLRASYVTGVALLVAVGMSPSI